MVKKSSSRFWGTCVLTWQANWKLSNHSGIVLSQIYPSSWKDMLACFQSVEPSGLQSSLDHRHTASFNFSLWSRISFLLTNLLVLCCISSNLHSYFLYKNDLNYTQHFRSHQALYTCTVSLITSPAQMPVRFYVYISLSCCCIAFVVHSHSSFSSSCSVQSAQSDCLFWLLKTSYFYLITHYIFFQVVFLILLHTAHVSQICHRISQVSFSFLCQIRL